MSDQTKKPIAERITLLSTAVIQSNFYCPFELSFNDVKGAHFDLGYNMAFNLEAEQVKTEIRIDVTSKNKDDDVEEAKAQIIYAFVYEIEGLNDLTKINEDNGITVDGGLSTTLASITYSTARGMLLSYLNGTCLNQAILPIINPRQLLDNMNKQKE